ncbi:MAG TPA: M3 family metallopeptidase [Chitinolyticbacter sp.]|nr:M3 family metallopeptidase [Chitinolyticbacter sp.]
MTQANPLLTLTDLPRYDAIRPEHVNPALDVLLDEAQQAVRTAETAGPGWDSFVTPLENALERLNRAWGAVAHLEAVVNTPELREVYNANIARISNFYTDLGQNEALYAGWKQLATGTEFAGFDRARRTIVEDALRDFKLAGAELPVEQKARYKAIEERLSELTTRFAQNVLDATDAYGHYVIDEAELSGLPDDWKAAARAAAEADGQAGWKIMLQMPSYYPVMQFGVHRPLREQLYRAFVTRASEFGPAERDNTPLINEIHALRQEAAQLLGFASYSERSLATKMADTPEQVLGFLRDLAARAQPAMLADRAEMERYAVETLGYDQLQAWDVAFVSERIREAKYAFSEQEVKQYFTESTVLSGLFHLIEQLYGLRFVRADAPVWHPDVAFYRLENLDGSEVGGLYLDLYAREGKQGGAWMNDVRGRRRLADGRLQTPVALIVCNFAKGVNGKPALLPHDDVITTFHEMGHALHHLLTEVDELSVSGISGVEWDAVELPSQFMENFCWEWQLLPKLTRHVESGDSLPRALFDKMLAAKNFQSGSGLQRQLYFSIFDMALHGRIDALAVQALAEDIQSELAIPLPPAYNRFPQSFSHIFAGGYAAGYYSYKWAEVLSADAYAAFEEAAAHGGNVIDPTVGKRFRSEILAVGGSRPAAVSFAAFRGRAPQIDALLRHNGLA